MANDTNEFRDDLDSPAADQRFRAELDSYSGPLDLLLYLIKRDEVDVFDIPVAQVTEEFLKVVTTLEFLDMNMAGEFLVMAATLMEIKSRMLLPTYDEEEEAAEEPEEDPRSDLIRQLLQYKRFKEAAQELGERAGVQQKRTGRPFQKIESEPEPIDTSQLLEGVEIWDLLAAFSTIIQQVRVDAPRRIIYDDVPMSVYRTEVRTRLVHSGGTLEFVKFFAPGDDRRQVISIFLALLDLVHQNEIRVRQLGTEFSEIVLELVPPEERQTFEPEPEPEPEAPAETTDRPEDDLSTGEDADEEFPEPDEDFDEDEPDPDETS